MRPQNMPGSRWRRTHQSTVDSILGPGVRKVRSHGSRFYNRDNWTLRTFGKAMVEWAEKNPGCSPDDEALRGWVLEANREAVAQHQKSITIAATPDEISRPVALALVGGGYHEAWHTKYSRLRKLKLDEVREPLLERWGLTPDWAGLLPHVLEWSNIVEDIRIERVGCREFPGAQNKMEHLQDLILEQEIEAVKKMKDPLEGRFLSAIIGTFRDLGLGYSTPLQQEALKRYQEEEPEAYLLVTEGALKPLLDRAMALDRDNEDDSLWIALEIVALLKALSVPQKPKRGKRSLWEVGDTALIKQGPHAGKWASIVHAGDKDPETGLQPLRWQVMEEAPLAASKEH